MKAIIIAVGRHLETGGVILPTLAEFLPVAGRPVIQRAVELLSDKGYRDLRFLLREEPERFRAVLGAGERWGVKISTALCKSDADPEKRAQDLASAWGGASVFDCLRYPVMPGAESLFGEAPVPDVFTLGGFMDESIALLRGKLPGMVPPGRERSAGVRISHHVSIHPTARINPPVFLAEGVEIGPGAVVGPDAVLERGVIVGNGTEVASSVVLPWTFLGDGLEIRDAVVDGGSVYKPKSDAAIVLDDTLIASSWRVQPSPASISERLWAILALGLAAPVLFPAMAIASLSGKRPLYRREHIVATPDRGPRSRWRHRIYRRPAAFSSSVPRLFSDFLPSLVNVAAGGVALWGLPPRSPERMDALSELHASIALTSTMGLLGEWVTLPPDCDEWECFAAEAWQASGQKYADPRSLNRKIIRALLTGDVAS